MTKISKLIAFFFLFLILYSRFQIPIKAQNEFSVDADVTYNVSDSGLTKVTHNVTLENNYSTLYATTYTLSLQNIDAENIKAFSDKGLEYPVDTQKSGDTTKIKITFPEAITGKSAQRHFTISYDNSDFAVKTGEVWEVSIPKLEQDSSFRDYKVVLNVPNSLGEEAYVSPRPISTTNIQGERVYTFSKSDLLQTGITAGFGQFQVFSFNLIYHLENPLSKSAQTQIALPPDTAFQKVYIQKLNPKPENVVLDKDGNWLAVYNLSSHERIDVNLVGSVQIFASYRPFPKPSQSELTDNLRSSEYWQVDDATIKSLASQLKTPRAIYDYVSQTLKYDISRVQPNVQRMGAVKALKNPDQAICMEFTDLFIAIARAAGIPAREINGYAYTENPQLQPLGLVADVLHSWPEYYDKDKGAWIPIDPTWAATSGGIDYFDKLDLRHFAFVIHGQNSTTPYPPGSYKLGPNPQKDVYVSFGKLPDNRISTPLVTIYPTRNLPFLDSIYEAKVFNPGPQALYSLYPTVYFESKANNTDYIEVLPPYSTYTLKINIPFSILGKLTPAYIAMAIDGTTARISTNKSQIIINSLLVIFAVFIIFILILLTKLKKINFVRFFAKIASKIKSKYGKPTGKSQQNTNNPKVL